jgi:hypothetical protein
MFNSHTDRRLPVGDTSVSGQRTIHDGIVRFHIGQVQTGCVNGEVQNSNEPVLSAVSHLCRRLLLSSESFERTEVAVERIV